MKVLIAVIKAFRDAGDRESIKKQIDYWNGRGMFKKEPDADKIIDIYSQ